MHSEDLVRLLWKELLLEVWVESEVKRGYDLPGLILAARIYRDICVPSKGGMCLSEVLLALSSLQILSRMMVV